LDFLSVLFLRKLPAHAGEELADVLMSRYEPASAIVTSNRPISALALASSARFQFRWTGEVRLFRARRSEPVLRVRIRGLVLN
jgi:hypothetical protein